MSEAKEPLRTTNRRRWIPIAAGITVVLIAVGAIAALEWSKPSASKSAAESMAHLATSADLTVSRPSLGNPGQGAPTVERRVGAVEARALAALIISEPAVPSGSYSCPDDIGGSDTVVFYRGTHRAVTASANISGCAWIWLSRDGRDLSPALWGSGDVDSLVVRDLGLPADYGHIRP